MQSPDPAQNLTLPSNAPPPEAVRDMLWRHGDLAWKLDSTQRELHSAFYANQNSRIVFNCSRRLGKSYLLCILALEQALRVPNSDVKYCAPTKRQVRAITSKLFKKILEECPADIKPEWLSQEKVYDFPNGSTISFGAMDAGRADDLRGTDAHLAIVDEAGFSDSVYVTEMIEGVLRPMCLLTSGKIIIASTPAKTPKHAFERYYWQARELGAAFHKTIYDNPRLSAEKIEKEKAAALLVSDTFWRREYLAEFVIDADVIVFPEFDGIAQASIVNAEYERPKYFDAYTAMDVGFRDATAGIFFYWDFLKAKLVVEDEFILQGVKEVRTDLIAERIRTAEQHLWGSQKPYFRICDTDLLLINDLDSLHGLQFIQKETDSKEAGVNELRLMIKTRSLVIHPRCKHLIAQIEQCVWDNKHEKFDRIEGLGHFDAVDALIYGLRSVRRGHNPFPATPIDPSKFYLHKPSQLTMNAALIKNLFSVPKRFGE